MIAAAKSKVRPSRSDWLVGFGLGVCSAFGQILLGLALANGVTGTVAFPMAKTASVFLVAVFGLFVFREKVGPIGIMGLVLGLAGVLLLSLE